MRSTWNRGKLLCAAALLTISSSALSQDNVASNSAISDSTITNDTLADPALNDLGNDLGTASNTEETALPADGTLANDMALAQETPREEDRDFPWGLLGLLGLAGLLGRKKHDDVYVANRTDRRDV